MNAATQFNSALAPATVAESAPQLEKLPSLPVGPTFSSPDPGRYLSFRLGNLTGAALPVASVLFFTGVFTMQPMTALLILAFLSLIGAPLIGFRQYRMDRRIARRVETLMLAHQTHHAERRPGQTANDNRKQYQIEHRFISSQRI